MSQHDLDVGSGQTHNQFRADANAALVALGTKQSGAAEPATKYAYEEWADTTALVLKRRNAANSAWIIRDTLAETFVVSRSSNTILAPSDFGRMIVATAAFTQTLTAAGTLKDGWHCLFRNASSGFVTIDPDGAELIDGLTTIRLTPGETCEIWCNGSAFHTGGRRGGVLLDEQIASNSAQLDFVTGITSAFKRYEFEFIGLVPATNGVDLLARVSTDGGSSFVATGSYQSIVDGSDSAGTALNILAETAATAMALNVRLAGIGARKISNATDRSYNGTWKMFDPAGSASYKSFHGEANYLIQSATQYVKCSFTNVYSATTPINAIRFLMSSGNIASGLIRLRGID
jgi:hypothetical protein